ncbi:MAG: glutaredoxin family protein [Firmicutes bacterium]|jgi:glutaredoxin 3|nr:glutaredoxin family protein [Bacillota bacterium]
MLAKKVTVYSTRTCPWCDRAKNYLRSKNVDFEELDVANDPEALGEMIRLSNQMGVPVITVDDEVIVGFDRQRLDALLN